LPDYQSLLRELPAVDRLLREPLLEELQQRLPRRIVLQAAQDTIALYRKKITAFSEEGDHRQIIDLSLTLLAQEAAALAEKSAALNLKPLINATGVIIHTNLGRAPLSRTAADALLAVARN